MCICICTMIGVYTCTCKCVHVYVYASEYVRGNIKNKYTKRIWFLPDWVGYSPPKKDRKNWVLRGLNHLLHDVRMFIHVRTWIPLSTKKTSPKSHFTMYECWYMYEDGCWKEYSCRTKSFLESSGCWTHPLDISVYGVVKIEKQLEFGVNGTNAHKRRDTGSKSRLQEAAWAEIHSTM